MKKKLLVLLLIIIVAAFAFVGCAPHPSEGEGEGEGEIEGVVVEFAKEYREDNRVYVAGGSNTITVTFPAPVTGMVKVGLSDCTGDYSRGETHLFPVSEDRTVWEGTVAFNCQVESYTGNLCETPVCDIAHLDCCATTVTVISGACDKDTCIAFPVIVDCNKPYAKIVASVEDCCCYDCAVTLKSAKDTEGNLCDPCGPTGTTCCGDDCSGLASWKVDIYAWDGRGHTPFVGDTNCCDIPPCLELIDSCEGADCPIDCVTKCLDVDWAGEGDAYAPVQTKYYAVITLKDNVGNTQTYYAAITVNLDGDLKCIVEVQEYCCVKENSTYMWKYIDYNLTPPAVNTTIGACDGKYPCNTGTLIVSGT